MVGRTFDLDSSGAAAWAKSGLKELERTEQREQLLDKAQRGSKTAGQELNSMFRTEDQTSLKKLAQSNDPLGRMARTEMSRREQEARALAALQAQRANASNKMIDMGDQGESVKAVQEKLRTLGYNIAADGQFGAQTQAAVRQFQRDYGIKADGVVGNQTFSVLGAADSTRHASDTIKAAAIQSAKQSRPGDISGHTLILSEASMNNVLREVERLARQAGPNAYVRTNIVDNKPVIVGIGYRQQPSANPRIQVMNSGSGSPASNPVQSATPSMNPVQISLQSFKEIGSDIVSGAQTRADHALDSPYDFANYITSGISGNIYSGAKDRADRMMDSPSDFANWLTLGAVDTVNGALNPEEPYSKEHWLNSFGLATALAGGAKVISPTKPGSSGTTTVQGSRTVQTGGRELSVDEYLKRLDTADAMYESFRKSNVDVQDIAKNTGVSENRIQIIKDHLFFKEHIKEHGVGRFEADYEIAQAWDRLQKGTYKQQDIDLLNHELFESKFEGIFKTDYRTAHDRTVDSGRPWYPPEEE
ncbi:hypothetical protein PAAL109150_21025 [Paenibacillus alkaliterrae]|uniref:peptidoglycan-binding domain-containing protein n=2 Tax=Paenibacillus alkaliterrae TaxID=320909 RepID=UPI0039EF5F2B